MDTDFEDKYLRMTQNTKEIEQPSKIHGTPNQAWIEIFWQRRYASNGDEGIIFH